jgi:hypothetical protein
LVITIGTSGQAGQFSWSAVAKPAGNLSAAGVACGGGFAGFTRDGLAVSWFQIPGGPPVVLAFRNGSGNPSFVANDTYTIGV